MTESIPTVHVLLGPTAAGKTDAAVRLAERLGAEILSADSMKIYRGMDIGTAKPDRALRGRFGFHLIDIREPDEHYDARQFVADAERWIGEIAMRGKAVLIEGGTALYLKCLTDGMFEGPAADAAIRAELEAVAADAGPRALHERLRAVDPDTAARLHPNDLKRVVRALEVHRLTGRPISELQQEFGIRRRDIRFKIAGLVWDRETLKARIAARVERMMDAGFLEEVRALRERPGGLGRTASQALGYRELASVLDGSMTLDEAAEKIRAGTWQFARRQMMWFRRFDGVTWAACAAEGGADPVAAILSAWAGE